MGPFLTSSTLEQLVGALTCQPCGRVNVTLLLMHWGVTAGDGARDQVHAKNVIAPVGAGKHKHRKHTCKWSPATLATAPCTVLVSWQGGQLLLGILYLLCSLAEIIRQALLWCSNMPRQMLPAVL